jgi:hypothetical protein
MNFKEKLEKDIKKQLNQDVNLRIPPSQEFGDYSMALFNQNPSLLTKINSLKKL